MKLRFAFIPLLVVFSLNANGEAQSNSVAKQQVISENAPKAIGTYSQAIKVHNTVYLSGQIGIKPNESTLVSEHFQTQAEQILKNLQGVCESAGGSLDDIVKLTVYLTSLDDFPALNSLMKTYFKQPFPARATVQVASLPRGAKVEIDAIMALP